MSIDDFGAWGGVASALDLDGVSKASVGGLSVASAGPDKWLADALLDFVPEGGAVLDLGCGLGRNLVWMARERPDITASGYDALPMVVRVPEYSLAKYGKPMPDNVSTYAPPDWPEVCDSHYDLAIASLVLQHLSPAAIAAYVEDLKQAADVLVVYGRRANDHSQKTTWELLEECGLHPDNADDIDYSPRGDKDDHYLCIYRIK